MNNLVKKNILQNKDKVMNKYKTFNKILIVIIVIQFLIIMMLLLRINYLKNNSIHHYQDWKIADEIETKK